MTSIIVGCLLLLGQPAYSGLFDNFHTVEKGVLYRSAQLSAHELQQKITSLQIKTVINLRGAHPGEKWFEQELAVTKANAVNYINIRMTALRIPTRSELVALLEALATAPRPILIHCQGGADRTGEAVGVYLFDRTGDRVKAKKAVSFKYFHLKLTNPAMDYFIDRVYQGAQWAQTYEPCLADYKYFDKKTLCPKTSLVTQ